MVNAKVGNKTAVNREVVIAVVDGIEVYVNTNMEIHARWRK